VHTVGKRLEPDAAFGRQLLELLLELGLGEAVAPGGDVARKEARAEKADLGETPLPGAPEELELDHAVLRRGVALCESGGLQQRGLAAEAGWKEDVRHAPLVARDRDGGGVGRGGDAGEHDGGREGGASAHACGVPERAPAWQGVSMQAMLG